MSATKLLSIALGAILVNNFILVQFLGICPFMGVSKKLDTAVGMGLAVTFVMGLASAFTWAVNEWLLVPLHLEYMKTVAFILVIAALVQFVEMFLQKAMPSLYTVIISWSLWSTVSPAVWASCWPSCCSPASGSAWSFPRCPSVLRASPSL